MNITTDKYDQEAILHREVARMGFNTDSVWRISRVNKNHELVSKCQCARMSMDHDAICQCVNGS